MKSSLKPSVKSVTRCSWVNLENPLYVQYHDTEWGVPVHDDTKHFEMLTLEGAQAGLSWETILNKRHNYKRIFKNFNPQKIALMSDAELEQALLDPGIVRNRLKVYSVRKNARVFLDMQQEFGSFDAYIWAYVDGKTLINTPKNLAKNSISDALSSNLKKRGMSFVGSTIMYAYLQAVGIINDHADECFCSTKCA